MGNVHIPAPLSPRSPRGSVGRSGDDKDALVGLPIEIVQTFNRKKGTWTRYQNGRNMEIYYQEHLPDSPQFVITKQLIEKYMDCTEGLTFTKITYLYNEKHIADFYKKWSGSTSLPLDPEQNKKLSPERQHVVDAYQRLLDKCTFNTDKFANPIILTAHGTEQVYALEMAISNMSSIGTSNGSFGDGLYMTTDPIFHYPYFRNTRQPCLLFSWVIPGDVNFISSPKDDTHLNRNKFGCNFVCVDKKGEISPDFTENIYNEIIISNQSQHLPCFIVDIAKDNFLDLENEWNRSITDPKIYVHDAHKIDVDLDSAQSEVMDTLFLPVDNELNDKAKSKKLI